MHTPKKPPTQYCTTNFSLSVNNLAVATILNSPWPVSHYRLLNVEFKVNVGLQTSS